VFAIALNPEPYKTYILSDQSAQSRLEVVPERGGIVTSWQLRGQEMFYLDTERYANPSLSVRGGIPILFPICGNLPDNTYTHNGHTYTLKQHGFARELPWEVIDRITQDRVAITLGLDSNDQTRQVYPFDFQVRFTYALQGDALEIHQQYTNTSSEAMPFATGLHPYFAVADKSKLKVDIPATQYQSKQDPAAQPFSGQFDFEQEEIDVALRPLSRQDAVVTDGDRHLQLKVEYDSSYSTLVFWAVEGKDFYCLEPWSAPRNAINTGDSLLHLEPGGSLETMVRFVVTAL
jgi:galactose mutarotase-like enzyme